MEEFSAHQPGGRVALAGAGRNWRSHGGLQKFGSRAQMAMENCAFYEGGGDPAIFLS
jgi:hypothetical protein